MLAIFDEAAGDRPALFADAAASLFRQWTLRSDTAESESGAPAFRLLDDYRPPTAVLLNGAAISVLVLSPMLFAKSPPPKSPTAPALFAPSTRITTDGSSPWK